ncbi:MAG: RNA polymerase sigma factor [Streptosporangiales bacterium]
MDYGSGGQVEIADLVRRASAGDRGAWEQLVDRYARLVWAVTRNCRMSESDASDVAQTTWLRLLEHIDRIEPARVGAWLATTARHECLRVVALRRRMLLTYEDNALEDVAESQPDVDESLLAGERAVEVRRVLQTLPERWQQLLKLSTADPPVSYAEISARLDLPIGSIGPMRGRCLAKLRTLLAQELAS